MLCTMRVTILLWMGGNHPELQDAGPWIVHSLKPGIVPETDLKLSEDLKQYLAKRSEQGHILNRPDVEHASPIYGELLPGTTERYLLSLPANSRSENGRNVVAYAILTRENFNRIYPNGDKNNYCRRLKQAIGDLKDWVCRVNMSASSRYYLAIQYQTYDKGELAGLFEKELRRIEVSQDLHDLPSDIVYGVRLEPSRSTMLVLENGTVHEIAIHNEL